MVTKGLACICLQALNTSSSFHYILAENILPEGMKDAQICSLHIVNLLALFCIFVLVSLILLLYFVINIFKINYTCCNGNGETVSTNWFARWLLHDSPSSSSLSHHLLQIRFHILPVEICDDLWRSRISKYRRSIFCHLACSS